MGEIVARLRAAGEMVSDEDLARISPLAYAHVIPNGTYVFDHSRRGYIAPIRRRRSSQAWGCQPERVRVGSGRKAPRAPSERGPRTPGVRNSP